MDDLGAPSEYEQQGKTIREVASNTAKMLINGSILKARSKTEIGSALRAVSRGDQNLDIIGSNMDKVRAAEICI